jgi:hypothetical protein
MKNRSEAAWRFGRTFLISGIKVLCPFQWQTPTPRVIDPLSPLSLWQYYKNVCALIIRKMKSTRPPLRINALYALSATTRLSTARLKSKDKYGASS